MAANAPSISLDDTEPFTMGSLWRLASWGSVAGLVLAIAVATAFSESGSRRLTLALGSGPPIKGARALSRQTPGAAEANAALTDTVRLLTAERDRLAARVDKLERQFDDLTGSIAASRRAVQSGSSSSRSESTAQSAPDPVQGGPARIIEAPVVTESSVPASSATELPKGEYGADIGSAMSFEGLRTLWSSTKAGNPDVFENLYPLVSVQENSRPRAPQLRLIVGPFADWEGAGRFCQPSQPRVLPVSPPRSTASAWPMRRGRLNASPRLLARPQGLRQRRSSGCSGCSKMSRVSSARSGLLPLTLGEGWGEGLRRIEKSGPPHPHPLPVGERERAGVCLA
jgi:hypothetical protein